MSNPPSPTYARICGLPVTIEGSSYARREQVLGPDFTRVTTEITLHGAGHIGIGEDVTYDEIDHVHMMEAGPIAALAGRRTLDEFSRHLAATQLFTVPPEWDYFHLYRRWAFESAALDLALRQAGASLADVLDRPMSPLSFVTSRGLGHPPDPTPVFSLIESVPDVRFKLDADPDWDDEVISALASTGRVATIDLKGHYEGMIVDPGADADLYRRVAVAFPDAWLEDPRLTVETRPVVADNWPRVTWDAPLHSRTDIRALDPQPRMINIKPSRFGPLSELFSVYDDLADRGIGAYGGGQGELGVGRDHIQYLAALFHPDTPNDVAPREFNLPGLADDLPSSPLELRPQPTGFGLEG